MPRKRSVEEAQDVIAQKRRRARHGVEAQSNDVIPLASTLDFHGVWRELKASGRTSKPPRGLDNRYRYVLPGCAAHGRSDHDFQLGEEAVLRHFVEHVAAADGDGGVVIGSGRVPAAAAAAAAADDDSGVVVGSGRVRGVGDDAGNGGAVIVSPTISTSSAISTTPRNPTSLTSSNENPLLRNMVAFSPSKESWMQKTKFTDVLAPPILSAESVVVLRNQRME
ncbi:unnamed protein product [Phytophthora fragariaefolia]|uniref:Unnamed protein product n=1 Tax=Phytophthora fragariaefolia TaxID=1490495 RepID=A0A9W7CRG6_9STRA|nr:unnamed protein product [Phytophthora fragariaefolia]